MNRMIARTAAAALAAFLVFSTAALGDPAQAPERQPPMRIADAFSNDAAAASFLVAAESSARDLKVALARVAQARAQALQSDADLWPSIEVEAERSRSRASLDDPARTGVPSTAPRTSNRATAGLSGVWNLDLFGSSRNAARAALLRVDGSEALERDVRIAWSRDVAKALLDYRLAQNAVGFAMELENLQSVAFDMERSKRRAGTASDAEAGQSEALLRQAQQARGDPEADRSDALRRLALLAGKSVSDVERMLGPAPQDALRLAARFPEAGSADRLRRRPDVVAAEAELAASGADTRAAVLSRFPQISLSATLGWVASGASGLGSASALASSLVPEGRWSLFDGGALRADRALAEANEQEAAAVYVDTVNLALVESEAFARILERKRESAKRARQRADAESLTLRLERSRFAAGVSDYGDLLARSRSWIQGREAVAMAERDHASAQLDLHAALGGDPEPPPSDASDHPTGARVDDVASLHR